MNDYNDYYTDTDIDIDIDLKKIDLFNIETRARVFLQNKPELVIFLNKIPEMLSKCMDNFTLSVNLINSKFDIGTGTNLGICIICDLNLSTNAQQTIFNLFEYEINETIYFSYRCTKGISPILAQKALHENSDYGYDNFKRRGKFIVGDLVYLKHTKKNRDRRFKYLSTQGIVVKAYAVLNCYSHNRNTYYRVLFFNKVISVSAAELDPGFNNLKKLAE